MDAILHGWPKHAILEQLDRVVSIDMLFAHSASAFGLPVWTLLMFGREWHWLTKREDLPWYPTMRRFRQHEPGGWTELIQRVGAAL